MANLTGDGWQRLDEHLELSARLARSAEPIIVSAERIKAISGREPRLMSKFDTRESRPAALVRATILPITNGKYAILSGDGYADMPRATSVKYWRASPNARALGTLPWDTGPTSESQLLDMANASGLLHDFLGDSSALLTIRGRLRSPAFEFEFETRHGPVPISVDGVQVEVDSGFEGSAIHLIEAKLGARTNFHIRQLYYPLRMWSTLVPRKRVDALFLTWSNRCFSLRKFRFDPLDRYQALRLTDATDYFLDEPTELPSLEALLETTSEQDAPNLPFPQADDLRRVVDVVDAVASGITTRAGLAARFDLNERQADYYANAAAFLGLIHRGSDGFEITSVGKKLVTACLSTRQLLLIRQILRRPVFRCAALTLCKTGKFPSREQISEWIEHSTRLRGDTLSRRATTVISWIRWAQQSVNSTQLELRWDDP